MLTLLIIYTLITLFTIGMNYYYYGFNVLNTVVSFFWPIVLIMYIINSIKPSNV